MGTNFYLNGFILKNEEYVRGSVVDGDDPSVHIGKRSAAGPYCWDCNQTLVIGGKEKIHDSRGDVYERCPSCGGSTVDYDILHEGAAAVELGFAKPNVSKPSGVRTCSSFSWAQKNCALIRFMEDHSDDDVVVDEYGRTMTGRDFIEMLENNCPVQFDLVGEWFS